MTNGTKLPEHFVTEFELSKIMPYSVQALRFLRMKGRTPKPIETGTHILYPVNDELHAFIAAERARKPAEWEKKQKARNGKG